MRQDTCHSGFKGDCTSWFGLSCVRILALTVLFVTWIEYLVCLLVIVYLYKYIIVYLYTSGPSLDTVLTNLQMSFNAIQLSFRGLQLLLNASKTKCMLFNRSLPAPVRPFSITTLDGSDLEYVDYKYLDVRLDCKLSFQTHIKHLQSKSPIYYPPLLSLAGPRFILVAKPTGSRSSTSLC